MAGAGGFEPPHACTKNRCLTAWPRSNTILYSKIQYLFRLVRNYSYELSEPSRASSADIASFAVTSYSAMIRSSISVLVPELSG